MSATKASGSVVGLKLSKEARRHFDEAVIGTVVALLPPGAVRHTALLQSFFELGARYSLDPLTGDIWMAQTRGRNGAAGDFEVFVGRDGYLKCAQRHDDFIACFGQPVYEEDQFEARATDDGGYEVDHVMPHPKDRTKLVGAYARLLRVGAPQLYFYASMEQYGKTPQDGDQTNPWHYTDAMIVKCAASYLLRTTYNISGPVPYDEVVVGFRPSGNAPATVELSVFPEPIASLWQRIVALDPRAFNEGELRARVSGATPTQLRQVEHELEKWLSENASNEEQESETVEVPTPQVQKQRLTEAWERMTDEERTAIRVLYSRRFRLEEQLDKIGDADPSEINAELDVIEAELKNEHGIETGIEWWPPPENGDADRAAKS